MKFHIISKLLFQLVFLIIYGTANSQELVEYELIDISCLNLISNKTNQFVINSETEFKETQSIKINGTYGANCNSIPKIDFEKYTLIGFIIKTGGCSKPVFNFQITTKNKEYIVKCTATIDGMCRRLWTESFWVLTKKIPIDQMIKFERDNQQQKQ